MFLIMTIKEGSFVRDTLWNVKELYLSMVWASDIWSIWHLISFSDWTITTNLSSVTCMLKILWTFVLGEQTLYLHCKHIPWCAWRCPVWPWESYLPSTGAVWGGGPPAAWTLWRSADSTAGLQHCPAHPRKAPSPSECNSRLQITYM